MFNKIVHKKWLLNFIYKFIIKTIFFSVLLIVSFKKKNGEPVSLKTAQANLFLVTLGPSKELRTVLKPPSRQILVQM